jgi:hypothetical protein
MFDESEKCSERKCVGHTALLSAERSQAVCPVF